MPVKPGPAYVTSATPESAHDTSVKLGPAHVMPSTPEPGNVTSVTARSAHVTSCLPSQGLFTLYKMVVSQEPLHKMAATAKMATTQRQSLIMDPTVCCDAHDGSRHLSACAAHYTPKASPVHESVPVASPVHESALEASHVYESLTEASLVHKSAPETSPVHQSAPVPPEAPTHELTVGPIMAMEAIYELTDCPVTAIEAIHEHCPERIHNSWRVTLVCCEKTKGTADDFSSTLSPSGSLKSSGENDHCRPSTLLGSSWGHLKKGERAQGRQVIKQHLRRFTLFALPLVVSGYFSAGQV
ncbi:Endogenous retrovirus group K member 13-1 Env polyprotein [Labeo rohita]|uniref:Endogenous retrovirus group K member 13-1 Env polyprotein n=1 Tax=Labeo rohita TaxID=84645 RepID=A0ABQ8L3Y8_LABRO|nr:Endogenous retrovirus group K member 13-1 Env polyprotein [Labeo rohita]